MKTFYAGRMFRYGMVPVLLGLAVLLSELTHPYIPHWEEYIFLAAVATSGWIGHRGPGLLAAFLAIFAIDYFFLPPLYTLGISHEAQPYLIPFGLSAWAAASMSATHHKAMTATEGLRQSEEKFRRILTNLPDVAWTADQAGRIIYLSPKSEELMGYSSQEVYAGGLVMLLGRTHREDLYDLQRAIEDLFADGKPFDVEFRLQRKDGAWIWLQNRAVGTYERDGVLYADGVVSDISRRKRAESELRQKTAFLEAQVNATIDGLLVVDENDRRVLINEQLVRMFNIPSQLLSIPEDRPMLEYVVQQVKDPESFVEKIRHLNSHPVETSRDEIEFKDGRVFDRYSAPVVDGDSNYYGRIWTFRDVTERKKAEDTLRQLSAAVEQSPASIVITDPLGNITYVNRKFSECTGYSVQEAMGKNPRILNSGYSPQEKYKGLWDTVLSGKEWRGEFRNKKKNGEIFWESAAISPIFDHAGNIIHILAVKADITLHRQMESELRQAQKLEGIGQLAAGIAHEINTPTQFVNDNLTFLQESWATVFKLIALYRAAIQKHLKNTPIAVAAELADAERDGDLDFILEETPRAITQSLDGARRVASIVRAMKEFSHPDSTDKTETNLNKGIASTVLVARNEWKYVADVVTNLDDTLPSVVCYPGEINQVILNLLVNAAQSIKEKVKDGKKGTITIFTRLCSQGVEIAITDTGMGIPEEIQTRIYEPFFTTKEVGKGTGQGLALAHSVIVKKHQGKLWFETKIGVGTTFFIQLPFAQACVQKR